MKPAKNNINMEVTLTTVTPDGKEQHHKSEMVLTFKQQRAIVERQAGGPCFRMWVSPEEHKVLKRDGVPGWATYRLRDGRWSYWRRESDVRALINAGTPHTLKLAALINSRRLGDDVR